MSGKLTHIDAEGRADLAVLFSDQQLYSNHLYLMVIVVGLLTAGDGGAALSLDAMRRGARETVPTWPMWLLRVQVSIVYGSAALSKVNLTYLSGSVVASYLRRDGPLAVPDAWRSLEPMLVLVCIDHGADSHDCIRDAGAFSLNILAGDQERLARRFAAGTVFPRSHRSDAVAGARRSVGFAPEARLERGRGRGGSPGRVRWPDGCRARTRLLTAECRTLKAECGMWNAECADGHAFDPAAGGRA
mgnify:CR=1 FL=1